MNEINRFSFEIESKSSFPNFRLVVSELITLQRRILCVVGLFEANLIILFKIT
jgi:hypothetical protein